MAGRKRLSYLGVVFALALVIAACGNSDDSSDDGGSDETTTSAADSSGTTAGEDDEASEDGAGEDADTDTFVAIEGVPGVSDEEIAFSVVGIKEGNPLGTCILDCYVDGIQAFFDYQNEQGGVFGRDLVIGEVLDDELANNQARSVEIISNDDSFGVFQATLFASGWGDLDDAGIPTFVWNIHAAESAGREAIFGQTASLCVDCLGRALPNEAQSIGATKVAALGYGVTENSKVCAQSNFKAFEKYGPEIGAEAVYLNDQMEFGLPGGVATEVSAMIDAEVDFVTSCMDLNAMKTLAQEFDRQGYLEEVTMHHPNSYNHAFVAENAALFEGDFVGPGGFIPYEADGEGTDLALVRERFEDGGIELSEHAMIGWINAREAFDAISGAGAEFDQQSAIDALNSETSYNAGGLIPSIDWTTQHEPESADGEGGATLECSAAVVIVDGEFETFASPETPWNCWDNSNDDWTEPEQLAAP
jgi:hypothetical protein